MSRKKHHIDTRPYFYLYEYLACIVVSGESISCVVTGIDTPCRIEAANDNQSQAEVGRVHDLLVLYIARLVKLKLTTLFSPSTEVP